MANALDPSKALHDEEQLESMNAANESQNHLPDFDLAHDVYGPCYRNAGPSIGLMRKGAQGWNSNGKKRLKALPVNPIQIFGEPVFNR